MTAQLSVETEGVLRDSQRSGRDEKFDLISGGFDIEQKKKSLAWIRVGSFYLKVGQWEL